MQETNCFGGSDAGHVRIRLREHGAAAEGILGKDKEARKQFKSLISDEWRVTRSVATGKAIKEHMEPTYFEILKVRPHQP